MAGNVNMSDLLDSHLFCVAENHTGEVNSSPPINEKFYKSSFVSCESSDATTSSEPSLNSEYDTDEKSNGPDDCWKSDIVITVESAPSILKTSTDVAPDASDDDEEFTPWVRHSLEKISLLPIERMKYEDDMIVGDFLIEMVFSLPYLEEDIIPEDAKDSLKKCVDAIKCAFRNFGRRFEPDNRSEAQFWRSGIQIIFDSVKKDTDLYADLDKCLMQSEEVKRIEGCIECSKNICAYELSEDPPKDMPDSHFWCKRLE